MTHRTHLILALVILAAALVVGCQDWNGDEARSEWQAEVVSRQRQPGQPGDIETPVPQEAP